MPILSTFFGILIKMFYDDHNPPHFHAEYGEHRAIVEIGSGKVLAGRLPTSVNCATRGGMRNPRGSRAGFVPWSET